MTLSLEEEERERVGKGGKQSSSPSREGPSESLSPGRRNLPLIIISTPPPPPFSPLIQICRTTWTDGRRMVRARYTHNQHNLLLLLLLLLRLTMAYYQLNSEISLPPSLESPHAAVSSAKLSFESQSPGEIKRGDNSTCSFFVRVVVMRRASDRD